MSSPTVVIIGAGMVPTDSKRLPFFELMTDISRLFGLLPQAGVKAARDLVNAGYSVTILEGRNRIGGRLWTDRSFGIAGLANDLGKSEIIPDAIITRSASVCFTVDMSFSSKFQEHLGSTDPCLPAFHARSRPKPPSCNKLRDVPTHREAHTATGILSPSRSIPSLPWRGLLVFPCTALTWIYQKSTMVARGP